MRDKGESGATLWLIRGPRSRGELHQAAIRAGYARLKLRFFAVLDVDVELELGAEALKLYFVWSDNGEALNFATGGRVGGGMDGAGAGAPFDEEGQEATLVVFKIKGFPLKEAAVGAFS